MRLSLEITIVVTSLLLVLLVLLHRGKGGGLSSLFGGGVQSSLAGSTQAERNLNRITIFVSLVWLVSIVGVGYLIKAKTEQIERQLEDSDYAVDPTPQLPPPAAPVPPADPSIPSSDSGVSQVPSTS